MSNFEDALKQSNEDIERPLPLPLGSYIWVITKPGDIRDQDTRNGPNKVVEFACEVVGPSDNVDEEAIEEFGGIKAITGFPQRVAFWFPESPDEKRKFQASLFRMKTFLTEHCQIECDSPFEGVDKAKGARFLASVKWDKDPNDPNTRYTNIDKTMPLEG